ncbi:MAG: 1-acyl-sn-glycerol-3-phosphate acyltransferase [Planctomycetes bacterium]|nr:1-acyl-sn-glycerol-3-phosphate acyltransferase [Planctomycetota bacterium]
MSLWYLVCRFIEHIIACSFYDVRFLGRNNCPKKGPVVLVCNHQSYFDPLLCGLLINRECDFMAKIELFKNPLFGRFLRSVNTFPVDQEKIDVASIRVTINRLKQNRVVVLFPEGQRTMNGHLQSLKSGFELIARKSRATILPVVIDGAFKVWPYNKKYPNIQLPIRVMCGRPIPYDQLSKLSRKEIVDEISKQFRNMMTDLKNTFGNLS